MYVANGSDLMHIHRSSRGIISLAQRLRMEARLGLHPSNALPTYLPYRT